MANEIDALLARVDDPSLRRDLKTQFDRLRQKRQFGLVFEEHRPERVTLPQHPVRRGTKVVPRDDPDAEPHIVVAVNSGVATIAIDASTTEEVSTDSLVAIAEFRDPIYPGLRRLGSVERGGDKPFHTVINAENYHALEALLFTHAGKVDCIYIDPPYNTGAKDWKYNNDYVDGDDPYRHSKWLAFMERRLKLAKELLNPEDSVLIVTIDEKEFHRLGLLLEQIFAGSQIQMVTTVIKPEGTGRLNEFSRTNEFLYFVMIGSVRIQPTADNMFDRDGSDERRSIEWRNLRRRERSSGRGSRPRQFYAVFVDIDTGRIHSVGEPLSDDVPRDSVVPPPGTRAVFPLRPNGDEMIWSLIPSSLRSLVDKGFARATDSGIQFLNSGTVGAIERGEVVVEGWDSTGAVIAEYREAKSLMPKSVWTKESHNSQTSGTLVLKSLVPGRDFPFPKSLYAVEDTIRFFVGAKRNAIVVDFFAGSGTTAHAVARLNRQDAGMRQSISITNNEVSEAEASRLAARGLSPGNQEWEALGIFEHITRPRIEAAITGVTPNGDPVKGDYKFTDEFPMAEGFEENVEFVEMTYLDAEDIELDMAFAGIAPLLWMRAGSRGPVIEQRTENGEPLPFAGTDVYAVLFDPDQWRSFLDELPDTVNTVFVVTDSASVFAGIAGELPDGLDVVRLYENYLTTFAINQGGRR